LKKTYIEHNYVKFGSTYLKYRKVVSEWMIEVCEYFDLHLTTSHAAIAYLDRLQPNEKCSRLEWQMLAISCILLSSKYNESEEHVPDLATLEEITQQSISNEIILNYELWILKKLGWKLTAHTPMAFLTSYLAEGVLFETDFSRLYPLSDIKVIFWKEVEYLVSLCAFNSEFKKYLASDVACAIILEVRTNLDISPVWNNKLDGLVQENPLSSEDIQEILSMIQNIKKGPKPEAVFEIINTPSKENKLHKPDSSEFSSDVEGDIDKENINAIARTSPVSVRDFSF